MKAFAGFFYGILLGIVLYYAILIDLEFGKKTTLFIGFIITLSLALGNACSIQVRCITLLILPSLCGKSGRGVFKTIVLAYVLGGPFMTISNNAKEAVRVFGCTTTLAYNLTKTRYELRVKPFQDALQRMIGDADEVTEALKSVREIIPSIVEEIEGKAGSSKRPRNIMNRFAQKAPDNQETYKNYKVHSRKFLVKNDQNDDKQNEQYERNYKKKLENRCQEIVRKGTERCQNMFKYAWEKCMESISVFVAWLLCWPLKLNYLCNMAEVIGGDDLCNSSLEIRPGFGEGYVTLKTVQTVLTDENQGLNMHFEVKNPTTKVAVESAADVAHKITKTFQDKKTIFDIVILCVKRLLALTFLRVVYKAAQYHRKYLTDIEYDNKYITKHFGKIDEKRRCRRQRTLLPMKKIERKNFIDPYAVLPLSEERKRILGQSFKLILEMITATTFILLDRLFYETLDIVSKHALVEYNSSGRQDMTISVKGTGLIGNLVRAIVEGFNCKRRVKVVHSNKRCLPKPVMLPNYYLYKIYGTYFLIWIFILLEGYTIRMNHSVCAYFYPKREKKRVLFLYNETLKRRLGFTKCMRARIRKKAREISLSVEANILLALRLRQRKKFDWIRYLPMGKRKCLACGELEPSKLGVFRECPTINCNFVHCRECWDDVGQICHGCQPIDSDEDTAIEDEDFGT